MGIFKGYNNIDKRNPWTQDFAVWVSRDYHGMIYQMTVPLWLALLGFVIILLNVLGWGIVGLIELVQRVL